MYFHYIQAQVYVDTIFCYLETFVQKHVHVYTIVCDCVQYNV